MKTLTKSFLLMGVVLAVAGIIAHNQTAKNRLGYKKSIDSSVSINENQTLLAKDNEAGDEL